MVWVREYFRSVKSNRVGSNFPNLSKFDPDKIKLLLSPLNSYEITSNIIFNEQIRRFCNKNPHLDILRNQRDIRKIKLSETKLKNIDKTITTTLFDNIPSATYVSAPDIPLEVIVPLGLTYSIELLDLMHVFLADSYKCHRFITSDEGLLFSLQRLKASEKIPHLAFDHVKSFAEGQDRYL